MQLIRRRGHQWLTDSKLEEENSTGRRRRLLDAHVRQQWRRVHWARSGLGPTFNQTGRARSGQVRLFPRLLP